MAIGELKIQRMLVDATKEHGHGFKSSNRFLAGVADLYLSIPGIGAAFVEVKHLKGNTNRIELTKLQGEFIKDLQAAGTPAGVCAVRVMGRGVYQCHVSKEFYRAGIMDSSFKLFTKTTGGQWPVAGILHHLQQRGSNA